MKIPLSLLQLRFDDPSGFQQALMTFFRANKIDVTIDKQIAEMQIFCQKTVAVLTQQNFFTGTFNDTESNMVSSYTRPESEHMIILGIKVSDGNNAVLSVTDWNQGVATPNNKNGELTIEVDGRTVLRDMPLLAANDDLTTSEQGVIELSEPILWKGQTNLRCKVALPAAGAAAEEP